MKDKSTKMVCIPEAIPENPISTVYNTENVVEVVTTKHVSNKITRFKKIDKERYVDTETGEVKNYNRSERKADRPENFRKSLVQMRRVVNANFSGKSNEFHIVLTYGTVMSDTQKLYSDFKHFIEHLRKTHPLEYICIPEPHRDGRWHIHALVKSDTVITEQDVTKLWKNGLSYVGSLPVSDNIGAYFSSYMTNLKVFEDSDDESLRSSKLVAKGARIKYYPIGMKLYRCSRGIAIPKGERMTREELKPLIADKTLCYGCTKRIVKENPDGTETILNSIAYEQYKRKLSCTTVDEYNNSEREG